MKWSQTIYTLGRRYKERKLQTPKKENLQYDTINTLTVQKQDYTIPADVMLKSLVLYNSINNFTQQKTFAISVTVHVEKFAMQSLFQTP